MTLPNPYESTVVVDKVPRNPQIVPIARHDPVLHRYIAATVDTVFSLILAAIVGKALPDTLPLLQFAGAIAAYFWYFILPEWLFATTPGKLLMGLRVVQFNGRRITLLQSCIRNLWRIVEVNPFFLGALPAGVCILLSENRQRFGDMWAKTLVLSPRRVERLRASNQGE